MQFCTATTAAMAIFTLGFLKILPQVSGNVDEIWYWRRRVNGKENNMITFLYFEGVWRVGSGNKFKLKLLEHTETENGKVNGRRYA